MQFGDIEDGEIEAVIALWDRCGLLRPWNDPRRDVALARRTPTARVLIGRIEGQVVASAMLGFDGHRGWAYYVAVEPELQGRGYGRLMIEAAEAWFRQIGAPKMQLLVRNGNAEARGFYEKLGFADQDCVALGKFLPKA